MIFDICIAAKQNGNCQNITLAADSINTALHRTEDLLDILNFEFEEGGSVCINAIITPPKPLREERAEKRKE